MIGEFDFKLGDLIDIKLSKNKGRSKRIIEVRDFNMKKLFHIPNGISSLGIWLFAKTNMKALLSKGSLLLWECSVMFGLQILWLRI